MIHKRKKTETAEAIIVFPPDVTYNIKPVNNIIIVLLYTKDKALFIQINMCCNLKLFYNYVWRIIKKIKNLLGVTTWTMVLESDPAIGSD
jgi:hypothetical protein